ncbi:hypothetical protein GCM10009825_11590 [Arthrobacter humicola]|uniref:Uncharacterized protein n=1 Tax=Arthrobacter humicola TaxID=409291 RepID=A0ABP5KGS9_9MICC
MPACVSALRQGPRRSSARPCRGARLSVAFPGGEVWIVEDVLSVEDRSQGNLTAQEPYQLSHCDSLGTVGAPSATNCAGANQEFAADRQAALAKLIAQIDGSSAARPWLTLRAPCDGLKRPVIASKRKAVPDLSALSSVVAK